MLLKIMYNFKRNRKLKNDFHDIVWPDNIRKELVTELEIYL